MNLLNLINQLLEEGVFDHAVESWKGSADEKEIHLYLDKFKHLKQVNFLRGKESDISPWVSKSFEEFKKFVDGIESSYLQMRARKLSGKDATVVYENDKVLVVKPNTFEASQKYGANTKWCISSRTDKHWKKCVEKGLSFFFVIPKDGSGKYAVTVHPTLQFSKSFHDEEDNPISGLPKDLQIPPGVFAVPFDWNTWIKTRTVQRGEDGCIIVQGSVDTDSESLSKVPFASWKVTGDFTVQCNQAPSLAGCPIEVGGSFNLSGSVRSLEGSPRKVGQFSSPGVGLLSLKGGPIEVLGDFNCSRNQLTSLEGAPVEVGGNFDCGYNELKSLEGAPKRVGGGFHCYNNSLISLEGSPKEVLHFFCMENELTSLKGGPVTVRGYFSCSYNKLTSLQGSPKFVGSDFDCSHNPLTSLANGPKEVGGVFECDTNVNDKGIYSKLYNFQNP